MTDKTELPVPLLLDGHTALLGQAVQPGPVRYGGGGSDAEQRSAIKIGQLVMLIGTDGHMPPMGTVSEISERCPRAWVPGSGRATKTANPSSWQRIEEMAEAVRNKLTAPQPHLNQRLR